VSHAAELAAVAERCLVAAMLTVLAEQTGDERFSRAAGAVRGLHAGRKATDDTEALRQMRYILDCATASGIEQAARFVSRTMTGHSQKATARRLSKKFRRI
jgi:hypothetical protein